MRRDPVACADLDNVEYLAVKWFRRVSKREIIANKDQALAASGNGGRCDLRAAKLRYSAHACHFGVSTASSGFVHDTTAIVAEHVVGQHLGHRGPVACGEVR